MRPARRFARRWLSLASLITLLAFLGVTGARALPGDDDQVLAATEVSAAVDPPTDPNFADPDWGAPKKPLPKPVTGWAPNQDTRKPKDFPHYGRVELNLCDLPVDKAKGGTFNKWTEGNQRTWARGQLKDKFGMDADYTNHELVEEVSDGAGGTKKVLAVYKTWASDHEKSGRGKLYHPRKPGEENYYGGISQMKALPQHHFEKAKPKKKRVRLDGDRPPELDDVALCAGEVCEICGPCAESAEDAASWCGDDETCNLPVPTPEVTP